MFIVLSTFTTISYIPVEKRVPQNAQKAPAAEFCPCGGAANAKLLFLSSCARHKARYIDGLCAGLRVLEEFCNIPYCKIRLINGQCTHYFKDNVPHFLLAKPFFA